MADIAEECRKASARFGGCSHIVTPVEWTNLFATSATEIDKLRKEVKALKASNASLVARNTLLAFLVCAIACGVFMAVFLSQ